MACATREPQLKVGPRLLFAAKIAGNSRNSDSLHDNDNDEILRKGMFKLEVA